MAGNWHAARQWLGNYCDGSAEGKIRGIKTLDCSLCSVALFPAVVIGSLTDKS
jgi:hypothetical protein